MNYAIITDNGGGEDQIYHDVEGQIYTFPSRYKNLLLPGTQAIYHRSKKTATSPNIPTRLSDESHYFGVAEIGDVVETNDGNLRATIKNYKHFKHPVLIHKADGSYYETNPFWQQGVRGATQSVYNAIVAASNIAPVSQNNKRIRTRGVKTTTSLVEGIVSNIFCDGKYQIVTGPKGYYLKNLADGVYYELGQVASFCYNEGTIKVLTKAPSEKSSFLILHNGHPIGVLEQISNGLRFKGKIDGKDIDINLLT